MTTSADTRQNGGGREREGYVHAPDSLFFAHAVQHTRPLLLRPPLRPWGADTQPPLLSVPLHMHLRPKTRESLGAQVHLEGEPHQQARPKDALL